MQVKALLIDCSSTGDLVFKVREIFESASNLDIFLEEIACYDADHSINALPDFISGIHPDLIFIVSSRIDLEQQQTLFQLIRKTASAPPIIVITTEADPDQILTLLRLGVNDFITSPIRSIDVIPRIQRLFEQHRKNEKLIRTMKEKIGLKELVGKTPAFLEEINKIPQIAQCDSGVMISGETGTGKELCARAIHYLSPRADKPFIPVNCGAIPTELVENELFGHIKGAFTGALTSKSGLIKEADGGTLFLDEIDCLPVSSQVKLLRFINEKEYRLLGSTKMDKADLRIISATNLNLERAVEESLFRRDLFYRLNVIPLMLPPLRERKEDIPLLARHFLSNYASEFNKNILDLSSDAMQKLLLYEWPGNVSTGSYPARRTPVSSKDRPPS